MYVFWNIDFGRISEGFWKGFGKPKSSIFAFFSMFFRCHFSNAIRKGQKSTQEPNKTQKAHFESWAPVIPRLLGRDLERGIKTSWA